MARVKRAVNAQKKRRVVLERASGYRGQRSRLYRKAKEQVQHTLGYAYRDRRARKGDFRRLWIQRINAAARANGMTYNRFIQGLKAAEIEVDRRMLAELAVNDEAAFTALVEISKANQPAREPAKASRLSLRYPPRGHVLTNPRADRVRSVRALSKRPVRDRTGRFAVEGPQGVREAVRHAAARVRDLYLTAEALARYADDIVEPARAAGLWVHEVTPEVLAAMAETDAPQGVLAVVDTATDDLDAVLDAGPRLLVLLTHVRDPGNAGTVIRGADAAGADAVLVSEASVDVHSSRWCAPPPGRCSTCRS